MNNLIAFCSGGILGIGGMTVRNNCVFGNGQNFTGLTDPTGNNGNISVDPQLATNPFYPDFHLLSNSPCRDAGDGTVVARTRIFNNLIAFGSSGISTVRLAGDEGFTNLMHNCVFGNTTNYLRMPDLTGTNGNISADPLLTAANDFHLGLGSPCIDAGTNNVVGPDWRDLDGQMRIVGASVDIGADEYGSVLPFTLRLSIESEQTALKLTAEAGRTYVFEISSNLLHWTAFCTNQATSALLEIGDDAYGNPAHRFYRAWVVP